MDQLLYGSAYYDEYMPCDRLDKDIAMMKAAGMNVVRIAESTWSTEEPRPGVFDFSHVTRVIDAMEQADMYVIVGTPTYAIPSWLEKMHPEVMAVQKGGRHIYGARQSMDITDPAYRFYADRIIRKLMEVTAHRKCVIGFQLDNETKYYDSAGEGIQRAFVRYLREKFSDPASVADRCKEQGSIPGQRLSDDAALERMNQAFGLDYWSNRVNSWEDFPDVRGTINGSLAAEFDKFRRSLVTEFLSWQASIVREYMRDDQFITHNFDYAWRDWSFGMQPAVDHFKAAKALAEAMPAGGGEGLNNAGKGPDMGTKPAGTVIVGCDIYHPTQEKLTGAEIAFGGDLNRSLLNKNYLVLETEAQGYPWWTPFPGQLRLQAYSHLASGADMVEYWHWHSIHNSFETYWKGVLSHDFEENDVYREAKVVGNEWRRIGSHLLHLKKHNQAAILISNEALTALHCFKIDAVSGDSGKTEYNDILRWVYDALYQMNIECDFICPDVSDQTLSQYRLLIVPALYSAPERLLRSINHYAEQGGVVIETFRSGFTDEYVKVWTDRQPHVLKDAAGVIYHEFAFPEGVRLKGKLAPDMGNENLQAQLFMELLEAQEGTEVLLSYDHPAWNRYAAVTRNHYGKGIVYYIGTKTASKPLKKILAMGAEDAGIEVPKVRWPVTVRRGANRLGHEVTFLFNYSGSARELTWAGPDGDLFFPQHGAGMERGEVPSQHAVPEEDWVFGRVRRGDKVLLQPWDLQIIENS